MLPSKGRGGGGGGNSVKDNKKMIFDRLQSAENSFGALCTELSSFTKKKARLRDKFDELSGLLKQAADVEDGHETLHNGLGSYSKAMTLLADINDLEVQRLHGKVVRELANYEVICKNTRELMKHSLLMRDKEMIRRQHLVHIKQRSNQKNATIENTDTDSDVSKSSRELDQNIITFEQHKIEDIKQILLDLTLIQLKQHAKSIEILSATYLDIAAIDVEKDVDAFKSKFASYPETQSIQPQMRSQSMNALTSIITATQGAKRQNLSNSAGSLESPKRIAVPTNGKLSPASSADLEKNDSQTDETSATESDDDDVDETTSHDESDSDKEIVQVQRRHSRVVTDEDDDDDDDVVEQRNPKPTGRNSKTQAKSGAIPRKPPVPLVRFSKIAHPS